MVFLLLKRLMYSQVRGLRTRFLQWTRPFTSSLPLQTLTDLGRSKSELVAENALLRHQLIILKRQVKRPACTKADRLLLVLLARVVRPWKQALFIVQPETRLALASGALPPGLETKVKDCFSFAEGIRRNHRLDQADGAGESTLGRGEDSRRTAEIGPSRLQANHSEVHARSSHTPATRPDVGNLSAHSRCTGLGL